MKWTSFKSKQPALKTIHEDFLVTDGKQIWNAWGNKDTWSFSGDLYKNKLHLTHWIMFKSIELPESQD